MVTGELIKIWEKFQWKFWGDCMSRYSHTIYISPGPQNYKTREEEWKQWGVYNFKRCSAVSTNMWTEESEDWN